MPYNVSSLTAYVDQSDLTLRIASAITATTSNYVTLMPGIKGEKALNLVAIDPVFQDGEGCGWTEDGDTVISQRKITTHPIKINLSWCDRDLEGLFTQQALKAGANGYDDLAFAKYFLEDIDKKIQAKIEKALWQSVRQASPDADLEFFDGFLQILTGLPNLNAGGTVVSSANIRTVFDTVHEAIPEAVIGEDDVIIYCGRDWFRLLTLALANANLYHFAPDAAAPKWELQLPWYSAKIVGVGGLTGTKTIIAARESNMFEGMDLEGDPKNYKLRYSEDNEELRLTVRFRLGTQVAFPTEIIKYVGA